MKVHTKELSTYLVPGSALTDEKFAAAIYETGGGGREGGGRP